MAPEIKEGRVYDGRKADIFSAGVILFIWVQGIFPFAEATATSEHYQLIMQGEYDEYWKMTGGESLSREFKDLIVRMLDYNPLNRPTIEEVSNHPWM